MEFDWLQDQEEFIFDCIDNIPDSLPTLDIAEYSEKYIVLPLGTPRPGRYELRYTPYAKEIMEALSPQSSKREVIMMTSVQVSKTQIAVNSLLYYMHHNPRHQLFATGSEDLIRKFKVEKLDPMIDSAGIDKIFKTSSKSSKMHARTLNEIQYPGGVLHTASAENPRDLRQVTKQIILADEIDSWKAISGHEGKTFELLKGRVAAFGTSYKILAASTPTSFEQSEIWPLYESGDQRKFYVPCPHCGTMQVLELGTKTSKHGLKFEKDDDGYLIENSVYYSCINKKCNKPIHNHHKTYMFPLGEWRATAKPKSSHTVSYHLSSLYAPINAITFEQVADKFVKAVSDPDSLHAFLNLYMGEPWKEQGYKPNTEEIESDDGRHYKMGEVPDGVLFLTAGIDVQAGEKGSKKNASRLEMEILGHGAKNKTYSIVYKKFYGSVDNPNDGAWEQLKDFWKLNDGMFYRKSDGKAFPVMRVFVDSGYNQNVVYNFCNYARAFFACRGVGSRVKIKDYGKRLISYGQYMYEVFGEYYKRRTYMSLDVKRKHGLAEQDPFFCDFPVEYGQKGLSDVADYFKMLTAEEMIKDKDGGFIFESGGRRNEALDCRAYSMAAADSWIDDRVEVLRQEYKKKGVSKDNLEKINRKWVIEYLDRKNGVTALDIIKE